MNRILILISTVSLLLFQSCDWRTGCTDCNAINFEPEAKKDNGRCEYQNLKNAGKYSVLDSITGPPDLEWEYRSYEIELALFECHPNQLILLNYANKMWVEYDLLKRVQLDLDDDQFTIPAQETVNLKIRQSEGFFRNDSIFFSFEYENEFGEVFYGGCAGLKQASEN